MFDLHRVEASARRILDFDASIQYVWQNCAFHGWLIGTVVVKIGLVVRWPEGAPMVLVHNHPSGNAQAKQIVI